MVIVRGAHSKPGTRLNVRSVGVGSKPWGASVRTIRVPVGLVIRIALGSDESMGSVEREMTGRMKRSGAGEEAVVSMVAPISRAVSVRR